MAPLSAKFRKALAYAFDLHATQLKKPSGVPYIGHLLSVAGTVIEHGGTETQAIAALLHDAAEDQGGRPTLQKIEKKFGPAVAAIVEDCTDTFEDPKPSWIERKRAYIRHLPRFPDEVLLVVAADKLDNCRRTIAKVHVLGNDVWKTMSGGRERLWYYRSVVDSIGPRLAKIAPQLFDSLAQAVADLEKAAARPRARGVGRRSRER